jgi:hypothetical protein
MTSKYIVAEDEVKGDLTVKGHEESTSVVERF